MTAALEPTLAAAYVHELSAAVRAVVVLDPEGARLAGPERLTGSAVAVARLLGHGVVRVSQGVAWVASGPEHTVLAVAGPTGICGPTSLDVAAAAGADRPVEALQNPSAELKKAVEELLEAL